MHTSPALVCPLEFWLIELVCESWYTRKVSAVSCEDDLHTDTQMSKIQNSTEKWCRQTTGLSSCIHNSQQLTSTQMACCLDTRGCTTAVGFATFGCLAAQVIFLLITRCAASHCVCVIIACSIANWQHQKIRKICKKVLWGTPVLEKKLLV